MTTLRVLGEYLEYPVSEASFCFCCWRRLVELRMDNNLLSLLEELRQAAIDFKTLSKKALGFFETILYKDILFNVSADFVVADLSPLAFFNLVEHIDAEGAKAAAARLYERLEPLLSCRHRWIEPTTTLDREGGYNMYEPLKAFGQIVVCELCTACVIRPPEAELPAIGREGSRL